MRQLWEEIMRAKIGLLSLALLAFGAPAASAEPGKIRVAWVAPIANWISIWLDKKDLAKHFGKSYVFEPVHFAGTPPMVTAIANNEVEIGDLAYSTLPIAIKNAGMDDIRIIADDIAMKAMLHKHGLENKRDYTVIEAPFPAMKAMLAEHKVDLIPGILPFALDPEMSKIGTPLFTAKDAIGMSEFVSFQARKPFIDKNRAALVDWLEDTQRILHWYLDPKNHDEAVQIAARLVKAPPERFGWVFTKTDQYRDPAMLPNLGALQKNVDMTKELGYASASFDVKAYSDLSMVEEAGKRLK